MTRRLWLSPLIFSVIVSLILPAPPALAQGQDTFSPEQAVAPMSNAPSPGDRAPALKPAPGSKAPRPSGPPPQKLPDVTKLRDNDVYLLTPEVYATVQRFANGELFDVDSELDRQIAERPHVFSLYFMAGILKVRRLLLSPGYKADDKKIETYFSTCLERSEKAIRVKKFHEAGMYYKAVCGAGLGLFYGIRGEYLKAHSVGREGMKALEKIVKRRPDLEGALLLQGIYNYFTGRFGFFTRLLLQLVGMPVGETATGIEQIKRAAALNGPMHYFTNVYAVYVFAPWSSRRKDALALSNALIKRYPQNYYTYLLRAYVYEKARNSKRALADLQRARGMIPGSEKDYKDIAIKADIFLLDIRADYFRVILNRDERALADIFRWSNTRNALYADAPLIANMYLGHLYSLAGERAKAQDFYEKMQTFPEAQWMKDLGKRYEERPMGTRWRLKPKDKKALAAFLKSHPEVKP